MSEDIKSFTNEDFTEESFIKVLKKLEKEKVYKDPTYYMSQKRKEQFNSYIAESIKKAKEDGY